jgi:hypothetical protein
VEDKRALKGSVGDEQWPHPGLAAALASVKSLVSIVMGLALTHTIVTVLSSDERGRASGRQNSGSDPATILPLSHVSLTSALCAAAVITAIIRFYHGNNQLLESLYGDSSDPERSGAVSGIGINSIVIMVQSVFFAVMSFYVDGDRQLILLFALLLLLDIFWYIANIAATDTDPGALKQQRGWTYNNIGFLFILAVLYYTKNGSWAVTAGAMAIIVNTGNDFRISWEFYFPPVRPAQPILDSAE